jgi:gliding motility-associated-like protein
MRLTWNHYYRWYPGIQKYRIYRSDEANPGYVLIDSVDKAPFDSLNSYTDKSDIPHQDIFRYVIEAVHSSGLTSLSSAGRDTVDNPVVRYNHIRKVSVDTATGLVNLKYIFNPFEIAKYYLLQRKTADLGYSTLDTFEFADLDFASGVPTIHYVDSTATPDRALYTYRMVVQDVCGVSIDTSGEFSNLFLYGEVDPFSYPKSATALKWEWVNNWPNDGEVFVVHRDVVRTGYPANFEPVYFIGSPVVRNHNDTVPQDPSTTALARFQYYLLAREENPNFEDFSIEELFSNRFALTHPPRLFTPTAFIPGLSNNGFFVPNGIFIDENKEFLLQVFNRWGQLQFETKDFGTSWDGTNKGKPCPQDTYVFRVLYTGRDEKLYDYNSSILLIRQE